MNDPGGLDAFDLRLLRALQGDGRLTNQQAAEAVGLSHSQCSRRRAALEARGVIRGYHARLSAERLGLGLLALIQVTLNTHNRDNARHFAALIAGLDEVQECYSLTGDMDYQLKVVVTDLEHLARFISATLLAHDSVSRVRSSIVLERLKEGTALPLNHLPRAGAAS